MTEFAVRLDGAYLDILALAAAADEGIRVSDVEGASRSERMGRLVAHGLLEQTRNDRDEETGVYVITERGRVQLRRLRPGKSGESKEPATPGPAKQRGAGPRSARSNL